MISRLLELMKQGAGFIAYVTQNFRLFTLVLALTFVVLGLEYAATSLMVPMAPGSAASTGLVSVVWKQFAQQVGMPPVFRTWLWLFFGLMSLRMILGYVLGVLTTLLGKQVHRDLSRHVFSQILLREPMSRVYTRSIGHYITLAGDDTFKCGTIVASALQTLVGFMTAVVGMVVLYQFSQVLFWSVTAFLMLNLLLILGLTRSIVRLNLRSTDQSRDSGTTFVEALNSLRSIRTLHGEKFVIETYAAQIRAYVRMLVEIDAIKSGVKAFPAIVLLLLGTVVLRPGIEMGMADATLFAGTIIIIRVFASLGQMVAAGMQILTDMRAVGDIDALLQIARRSQSDPSTETPRSIRNLSLRHVSFAYGDRGQVLHDVSFEFESGHTYAIVGSSGSGKSTLADIVLGLSLPDSGTLQVNQGEIPLNEARSRFMLVEQQPKIFSSSVKENLLMGLAATEEDLYSALQVVNMESTVRELEQGLDTRLSYLGENFSGGQRQRLGIARALLRQPDVLILDEATSALDPETRVQVVAKLRERMRDGIIIFITHDEEIAALADEVLKIEKGAYA